MNRDQFTLLELLTSLAILLVLTGLILGSFGFATKVAKKKKTKAQITAIEVALTQYKSDWGFYPESDTNNDNIPDVMELNESWWDSLGTVPYFYDVNADGRTVYDPNGTMYSGTFYPYDTPLEKSLIDNHELGLSEDPVYKYVDVYGNPFYYQSSIPGDANMMNPEKFDLWSKGPDGAHGDGGTLPDHARSTAANDSDDINNWSK